MKKWREIDAITEYIRCLSALGRYDLATDLMKKLDEIETKLEN